MKIGLIALGRNTFDVEYAEMRFAAAGKALLQTEHSFIGGDYVLMDESAADKELEKVIAANPERILVLQVTFTDATFIAKLAKEYSGPLDIWAFPEPRLGGRLRLNAFCGLNLASHALDRQCRLFSFLYKNPEDSDTADSLNKLFSGDLIIGKNENQVDMPDSTEVPEAIRIAKIGNHPDGFDTCRYNTEKFKHDVGGELESFQLDYLFDKARNIASEEVGRLREDLEDQAEGLEKVNQEELDRSLRLKLALDEIRKEGNYDAFALRCWPETFTEYGGAICAPASLMGQGGVPCACEADVYGAATQVILQRIAGDCVFLVDIVDVDANDNSGVVWHCGQAPLSMAADKSGVSATVHTNRKKPLLFEFALKPGPVTFCRLSQAGNRTSMIIAGGEMLAREKSFTGTSGVVRFSIDAGNMLSAIMNSGLEHHMALAYGDHREALRDFAKRKGIPVMNLEDAA